LCKEMKQTIDGFRALGITIEYDFGDLKCF